VQYGVICVIWRNAQERVEEGAKSRTVHDITSIPVDRQVKRFVIYADFVDLTQSLRIPSETSES
jgi:hypothetical protein